MLYIPQLTCFIPLNLSVPSVFNICCGITLLDVSTSPNCPSEFLPAPHIVPSAANIAIWLSPDDICIIFSVLSILYGVIIADEDAVLFPNSPYSLSPHDHTVPSFFSTCIVLCPDEISITSVRFGTCLNSFDGFVSIPDVPYPLYPVVHTVPSFFSIAVY